MNFDRNAFINFIIGEDHYVKINNCFISKDLRGCAKFKTLKENKSLSLWFIFSIDGIKIQIKILIRPDEIKPLRSINDNEKIAINDEFVLLFNDTNHPMHKTNILEFFFPFDDLEIKEPDCL